MAHKTIMLIDDELEVLDSLKRVLTCDEWDIIVHTDPLAALNMIKEKPIDLLICDIRMPSLDGLDLLAMVKQVRPKTIRIILSGQLTVDKAKDAVNRADVDKLLTKPWDNTQIKKLVKDLLSRDSQDITQDLEKQYPGITKVDRDATGNIRIDLDDIKSPDD